MTRMLLTVLKSKIHRAVVTGRDKEYAGSITVDGELLSAAGILPYEKVLVVDVENGSRFDTYCLEGPGGGGDVRVNGAAARLVAEGDRVIIMAFALMDGEEARGRVPTVVLVDGRNRIA
jgi:aspartate 1-decarboxylase